MSTKEGGAANGKLRIPARSPQVHPYRIPPVGHSGSLGIPKGPRAGRYREVTLTHRAPFPPTSILSTGEKYTLPHGTPAPPAPLTSESHVRLEEEAPRRYHHTMEPAPPPQGHGGGERLRARGTLPPLLDEGRGGHILPLPRRSPSPQRPVGERAEGKDEQQLGHRAGPPGWQRDNSTITSSPDPGDPIGS